MSGICGVIELAGAPAEGAALDAMLEAAAYRGPDGRGRWVGGLDGHEDRGRSVALGHLALHVTPESVHERQPLADPEAGLVLVADARLDNRDELIRKLDPEPARADGGTVVTDAALIAAAYRRWGEECAARLLGDFAFAIWDGRRRQLFAARDAMGMRGLYYRLDAGRVLFATEVKQILAAPGVPAEVFDPAVAAHLAGAFGPPDWTFYRGVAQLAPAHALVVSPSGHRTWRYWDINPHHRVRHRDYDAYAEQFRSIFADAVRARLRSVKPVGLLLSGGVDSGSIAAMAGWLLASEPGVSVPEFRAYSFAFDELTESDERHISRPLAEHFGIPVTEVPADDAWPLRDFPAVGPDPDDPYASVYQVLRERSLARASAEGMGTLMTGDRGDELVGDWVRDLPGLILTGRWGEVLDERRAHRLRHGGSLKHFIRTELVRPLRWSVGQSTAPPLPIPPWVGPAFALRVKLPDVVERSQVPAPCAGAAAERYRRVFRPGGSRHAAWQERVTARHGMNWSDPWSDRRLAEYVLAIPQHAVNRLGEPKRLARRALAPLNPSDPRRVPRKIFDHLLFDRGFRERGVETVRSLFTDSRAHGRGYVHAPTFLAAYGRFVAGEQPAAEFWWPIALEGWLRAHVD